MQLRRPAGRSSGGRALALTLLIVSGSGCGQKGPPQAPLVRVPAPVTEISARRLGDDVYVTFEVPARNIDGSTPVFIDRVELRALVAGTLPSRAAFLKGSTLIADIPVQVPDSQAGASAAQNPAVAPGATVTIRDTLLPPVAVAAPPGAGTPESTTRYYLAVPASDRRASRSGTVLAVPLTPPPAAPAAPGLTVRPRTAEHAVDLEVTWLAGEGADGYNVYRVEPKASDPAPAGPTMAPVPLNGTPVETPRFSERAEYGESRCYVVRAVRLDPAGTVIESAPSPSQCETPVDTVAPSPPEDVAALAGNGEITIVWNASPEPDVVGYLILRGRAGDDTLALITAAPVPGLRYVDSTVTPGERYQYAVVAVDSRTPQGNQSPPSARDEATAR